MAVFHSFMDSQVVQVHPQMVHKIALLVQVVQVVQVVHA